FSRDWSSDVCSSDLHSIVRTIRIASSLAPRNGSMLLRTVRMRESVARLCSANLATHGEKRPQCSDIAHARPPSVGAAVQPRLERRAGRTRGAEDRGWTAAPTAKSGGG